MTLDDSDDIAHGIPIPRGPRKNYLSIERSPKTLVADIQRALNTAMGLRNQPDVKLKMESVIQNLTLALETLGEPAL